MSSPKTDAHPHPEHHRNDKERFLHEPSQEENHSKLPQKEFPEAVPYLCLLDEKRKVTA